MKLGQWRKEQFKSFSQEETDDFVWEMQNGCYEYVEP